MKAAIWIVQIKEHHHYSAADTPPPRCVPPALGPAQRAFGRSNPCSHGAFALNIHLAARLRLLAELLLREGDVGIHQASCNTENSHSVCRGDTVSPGLRNASPSALRSCYRACFLTLLQDRRQRRCSLIQKYTPGQHSCRAAASEGINTTTCASSTAPPSTATQKGSLSAPCEQKGFLCEAHSSPTATLCPRPRAQRLPLLLPRAQKDTL